MMRILSLFMLVLLSLSLQAQSFWKAVRKDTLVEDSSEDRIYEDLFFGSSFCELGINQNLLHLLRLLWQRIFIKGTGL